jgi:hypothetical protein
MEVERIARESIADRVIEQFTVRRRIPVEFSARIRLSLQIRLPFSP